MASEMVLLHEWHIGLHVRSDLDNAQADRLRDEVGKALRQWAAERSRPGDHHLVTVDA